jgi:hypothetical protein
MTTLSIHELTSESAELLPTRETLDFIHVNIADLTASNSALALNAASVFANAQAAAFQQVNVLQG